MIYYEDECVGCPPELGCFGEACPNRKVKHCYCDDCNNEFSADELYIFDDKHLCTECLLKNFNTLE